MTFKHKLSHRLALLRAPAAALALLASVSCTEGDLGSLAPYESMTLSGDRVASISPKSVTIEAGQTFNFKSTSDSPEGVKWTSTGGTISSEGGFKAAGEGSFVVVSRVSLSGGEKVDTAHVRVVRREEDRALTVSPRAAELQPGQSVRFTATAMDPDGNQVPAKVNWKASGGEMDRDGNYIAGTAPGTYLLVAFIPSAGVADTVSVTISASTRKAVRLLLAPATAAVVAGAVVRYTASAQYEDGSTEPVWASFSATGGSITPAGQEAEYVAGSESGSFQVSAKTQDGSMQAQALVTVAPPGGTKDLVEPVIDPPTSPQPTPLPSLTGQGNEPAGFTPFMNVLFDPALRPITECNGWLKGELGCWWRYGQTQSIKSVSAAPMGEGVLELTFPAGLQPGHGLDMFGGWGEGSFPKEYRQVYESGWFKIPSADFETQLVGVKLWGYWGVGSPSTVAGPVQTYMVIAGNETNTSLMSSWNIWFAQQGADSRRLDQNLNRTKKVTANTWHRYEILMTVNDIGARNGTLKVWLDGVQILSHSDVLWRNAANPTAFYGRKWDPIWGGGGGTAKSRTDRLWINRVYMSGIPK